MPELINPASEISASRLPATTTTRSGNCRLICPTNTVGVSFKACASSTKMPTSPATKRSLTLSAEGTCHSRRAPPTASRKVCRNTSSLVSTTSSTISLARLNRRASSVPPSSSEASTGCYLSLSPAALQQRLRRSCANQASVIPRATLYDTESQAADNVCCTAS